MESDRSELSPEMTVATDVPFENRALSQEPRYEPASVIPLKRGESLLKWLASNGRLSPRQKRDEPRLIDEEEDLSGLMDDDDKDVDDDSDDDSDFNDVEE
jgi:hypothetical protein